MLFRQIYDDKLAQYAYLVGCQQTGEALVIDPERDIDRYVDLAAAEGLTITAVAETHIHADFLSGARQFADQYGTKLYLSDEGDEEWKYEWIHQGNYDVDLLKDGDTFRIGNVEIRAVHTPGHTPEHLSYLITDRGGSADEPMGLVTGDFIFVGDAGRPDLLESAAGHVGAMEPSARRLYHSARHFLELPDYLQVWPGHGAGSACGKALGSVPETTVGYEKRFSPAMAAAQQDEDAFVHYILSDQPEPPLYFGRMKVLNRDGVPGRSQLPQPERMTADDLDEIAGRTDAVVLDSRLDRVEFLRGHLPGAIYAPFNKSFPTIAGSYVKPEQPVYLIISEEELEKAVRTLIRIGLDEVAGYVEPEALAAYVERGGEMRTTEVIDFDELERRRGRDEVHVLDVRGLSEYRSGHIPASQNVAHSRLPNHLDEVPKDKQLLVHCGSGRRASSASSLLERYGHEVVTVNDEWSNWAETHPDELVTRETPV